MCENGDLTILKEGKIQHYAHAMKKLINNEEFSNVRFLVGHNGEVIYAHQSILAAHCTVFKAMFLDALSEGAEMVFPLADMTPEIFLSMLEYIYTNCITLSPRTAVDVLATALEYGLDDLRDLCVEFLHQNLTVSNACDVMQTAVTYNQNDLKEMAMTFIEENTQDVLSSESFKDISEDALVSIIRSNKLKVDELDIIKAVKLWASINCVVDGKKICDAHEMARDGIKHLRLPLLSPEELRALEEESKKDNFIPAKFFTRANEFHNQWNEEHVSCMVRRGTVLRDHHKKSSE